MGYLRFQLNIAAQGQENKRIEPKVSFRSEKTMSFVKQNNNQKCPKVREHGLGSWTSFAKPRSRRIEICGNSRNGNPTEPRHPRPIT
jgi:hypothetical protein